MRQLMLKQSLRQHDLMQCLPLATHSESHIKIRLGFHESYRLEKRSLPGGANTLELAFESKSLRAICENDAKAKDKLGPPVAETLKHRLADLRAATSTKDLLSGLPRVGADPQHMIVDLCNGYSMVFKANHTLNPKTETDQVDWERVSRIKILRIETDHA